MSLLGVDQLVERNRLNIIHFYLNSQKRLRMRMKNSLTKSSRNPRCNSNHRHNNHKRHLLQLLQRHQLTYQTTLQLAFPKYPPSKPNKLTKSPIKLWRLSLKTKMVTHFHKAKTSDNLRTTCIAKYSPPSGSSIAPSPRP